MVLPVEGHACDFWKLCFAAVLRAIRPLLLRAQDAHFTREPDAGRAFDVTAGVDFDAEPLELRPFASAIGVSKNARIRMRTFNFIGRPLQKEHSRHVKGELP